MSGLLYVSMQPAPGLPEAQFHEWYNNEHGPTRLRLPDIFANGLRYRAADGQKPSYLAVYDVTSMHHLDTSRYTDLRANRSEREAGTISQVEVKRDFYDLVHERQHPDFKPVEQLPGDEGLGRVVVAVEIETKPDADDAEYIAWYTEEHAEMLSRVPGWLRSRLFKASPGQDRSTILALHEYTPTNGLDGPEHKASMDTPRRTDVFTRCVASKARRTWSLFYVFGPAPRDLSPLAALPPTAHFTSDDFLTRTHAGSGASISSYITTTDDVRIPYRLEGSTAPAAPTIALSNSLLTSLHMWDPFVSLLTRHRPDLRILRYDTRGRHRHTTPSTLDDVTADLASLLDALRIPKLHSLLGVSMGGATAANFALRHPSRLQRLVACDFNVVSSPANTQAWKDRIETARANNGRGLATDLAPVTVQRWFHPDTNQETVKWMIDMVAANDVDGFANSCTALWDYDLRPRMPECSVPSLLVVGEADGKGALVKAMDGFKGTLGPRGSELKIVPRAGHLPMCENPDAFWDAIVDFLA